MSEYIILQKSPETLFIRNYNSKNTKFNAMIQQISLLLDSFSTTHTTVAEEDSYSFSEILLSTYKEEEKIRQPSLLSLFFFNIQKPLFIKHI